MLRRPDVDEVIEYGRALGIRPHADRGAHDPRAHDGHGRPARGVRRDARGGAAAAAARSRIASRAGGRRQQEDPLGAFITTCRVKGADSGPLHGKTVALKDHIALAGVPLTFSSHMMDGYVPDFDATVVTRLLDAGATIVGKLKMEEFSWGGPGLSGVGDYGRPLNPHDRDHVTGGSSSGSGAAVAGRPGGHRARRRSGRLDSIARRVVRLRGPHADARARAAHRRLRPRAHDRLRGADGAHGGGHRGVACSAWPGRDGLDPRQADVPRDACPTYADALARGVKGLRIGVLDEGFGVTGGDPRGRRGGDGGGARR